MGVKRDGGDMEGEGDSCCPYWFGCCRRVDDRAGDRATLGTSSSIVGGGDGRGIVGGTGQGRSLFRRPSAAFKSLQREADSDRERHSSTLFYFTVKEPNDFQTPVVIQKVFGRRVVKPQTIFGGYLEVTFGGSKNVGGTVFLRSGYTWAQ